MRNVLVTGAYGLLGSWLVKGLLERGDADVSYDLPNKDFSELKTDGKLAIVSLDVYSPYTPFPSLCRLSYC